ncbi:MAG: hypothetical protein Q7S12_01800 [bacterium]|nr:hypothetical protein [bacterium]
MTQERVAKLAKEFIRKYNFDGACGVGKDEGKYCIRVVLQPQSHNVKLPQTYKGLKVQVVKGGTITKYKK